MLLFLALSAFPQDFLPTCDFVASVLAIFFSYDPLAADYLRVLL